MARYIAPATIRSALPIFTEFLAREGYDEELAIEEFARIVPTPSTGEFLSEDEYVIFGRRTGSMTPLNRESRRSIYMSFENSLNHAEWIA